MTFLFVKFAIPLIIIKLKYYFFQFNDRTLKANSLDFAKPEAFLFIIQILNFIK